MNKEDEAIYLMRMSIKHLIEEGYSNKDIIQEFKYLLRELVNELE